ncbi:hypothetical protein [Bdellovibrio svalbardensis]|uniref:Transglycosylase SLT domain-containing protein n=1 Tax=Bdellovibrio svalbardensis TaxID=2972972 RepID=A0ABT6DJM9_9BACT|nr:hypothetical protein [Bdellovibrio svalbardensis]MDG0817073.1 hypothetical protein [Bdellovibrio svalbardensis]
MKYLASLIFFASIHFIAHSALAAKTLSEASNCVECSFAPATLSKDALNARSIRNAVSNGTEPQSVADIGERMNWAATCSKFAKGNSYGPWGLAVISELETNKYDELIRGSSDLYRICPGYQQMDRDGKNGMWVAIIAAMANHESSCRENPPLHGGPNGTLVGLMQLHKGRENAYSPDGCKRGDGSTAKGSIRCSLSMINDQLGRGLPLFAKSGETYWEVLQRTSRKKIYAEIQEAIQDYALCR